MPSRDIVMAYIVLAHVVMAYTVMSYIVMAPEAEESIAHAEQGYSYGLYSSGLCS